MIFILEMDFDSRTSVNGKSCQIWVWQFEINELLERKWIQKGQILF